jgi:nicotinamide-nucleotide amidase
LLLDEQVDRLKKLIPELIFGYETQTLEAVVGALLKEQGLTIGTAESCTGGYLAHQITSVAGSSAYFTGSVIAYSNQVKINQLGVSAETLKQHGAVSEPVVEQMVEGALKLLGTDLAVATSGIAGPTGGTPQKPVGTIWLAVGSREKIVTRKLQLGKDRLKNIQYATVQALNMVRQFVTQ